MADSDDDWEQLACDDAPPQAPTQNVNETVAEREKQQRRVEHADAALIDDMLGGCTRTPGSVIRGTTPLDVVSPKTANVPSAASNVTPGSLEMFDLNTLAGVEKFADAFGVRLAESKGKAQVVPRLAKLLLGKLAMKMETKDLVGFKKQVQISIDNRKAHEAAKEKKKVQSDTNKIRRYEDELDIFDGVGAMDDEEEEEEEDEGDDWM